MYKVQFLFISDAVVNHVCGFRAFNKHEFDLQSKSIVFALDYQSIVDDSLST